MLRTAAVRRASAGGRRRGLAARGRVRSSYVTAKAEMRGGLMFGLMLGSDDDGVDDELDDDDSRFLGVAGISISLPSSSRIIVFFAELDDDDDDDADSGSFDYAAHDY
mmetsp:Transcript_6450/g.20313  ORF Transcript_6450/g.20313 Transcript_6450/m.20313 type:complete len:108 (+) Transcript_6450:922-1245(+)